MNGSSPLVSSDMWTIQGPPSSGFSIQHPSPVMSFRMLATLFRFSILASERRGCPGLTFRKNPSITPLAIAA